MKPIFITTAILLLLTSCVDYPKLISGKYVEGPYTFATRRPYDRVWHDVTDYFNANKLPLRIADSLNGRIGTYYIARKDKISYENNGVIADKNAWLVLGAGGSPYLTALTWQWDVTLDKTDKGVLVCVLPLNVTVYKTLRGGYGYRYNWLSTGVFEKMLEERVKTGKR